MFQLAEVKVAVDHLSHLVAGLDVQGDVSDHAERSEAHDGAAKGLAIPSPGERVHSAVRGHELNAADRRGEVAVAQAGAMGGGGDGTADADVRQGGEVRQGEARLVELQGEVAVAHTRADGHGPGCGVDADVAEAECADLRDLRVSDAVEAVPGAKRPHARHAGDGLLHLLYRDRLEHPAGAVVEGAGPVLARYWCGLYQDTGRCLQGSQSCAALEKLALVHAPCSPRSGPLQAGLR